MKPPPGHTCPTIDTVIALITSWYKDENNNIPDYIYKMVLRRMEELRDANADLRRWGLELEAEAHDLRGTIKLQDAVAAELREDIVDLNRSIKRLKEELNECYEDRRKQREAT